MALNPEKTELRPGTHLALAGSDQGPSNLGVGGKDVYQLPQAQACCPPFPNPDLEEGSNPGTISNLTVSTSLLVCPLPNMQRDHMTQTSLRFRDQTLPLQSKDLWGLVAHTVVEPESGSQTDV